MEECKYTRFVKKDDRRFLNDHSLEKFIASPLIMSDSVVVSSYAPLTREPICSSPLDSMALLGDRFFVLKEKGDYSYGQIADDGYLGWVHKSCIDAPSGEATHVVSVPMTYLYSEPDIKSRAIMFLPMRSWLRVVDFNGYAGGEAPGDQSLVKVAVGQIEGYAPIKHLAEVGDIGICGKDFVATAEKFVGTPYLWGGKLYSGIDCSGLVQLSLQMAGFYSPRDSDMQRCELGIEVNKGATMKRGDLIFWDGHVGIMRNEDTLIHANAYTMSVFSEPLGNVIHRLENLSRPLYVKSIRRLY